MLVSTILKSKSDHGVVTLPPDTPLAHVVETLCTRRIGAVVISDTGMTLLGILSERDVVRELGRHGAACMTEPAASIMTVKVVTCTLDDRADEVLQRMTDGRFRHLPVMDGASMVGLISIGDVVKARLGELAMENDALEGMIKGF
ncbi:MAG: CBS domain-containing protein [Candidatus Saccharibacteria bacterium]|nr:CBS domain-containing protein [Pseudorhodobacter sp.]